MFHEVIYLIAKSQKHTSLPLRYDVSLDINTRGPSNLMGFAKKFKKLKFFLQVSTAYVNGRRQGRIMEKPFTMGDCIATENFLEEKEKSIRRRSGLILEFSAISCDSVDKLRDSVDVPGGVALLFVVKNDMLEKTAAVEMRASKIFPESHVFDERNELTVKKHNRRYHPSIDPMSELSLHLHVF
ncbi:unnamed protein product [Microthlaspi erraticum]|uniref:Fatty acyl-CoA reductase n=1 Tax=Microthlaspi erraticum TaxID=1685480 RepID=A0A6D2JCL7_9BRAS|nr:unnamed protein product [Microthlaspi erraticum]